MPDYVGMNADEIVGDFKKRIEHYDDIYEPLELGHDSDLSWIKIRDAGRHIQMNQING